MPKIALKLIYKSVQSAYSILARMTVNSFEKLAYNARKEVEFNR